jgi:hypothetical protein
MKILVGMPSKDSWGGPASSEPPFVAALRRASPEVREEVYVSENAAPRYNFYFIDEAREG